jgi:hypothetical protein
LHTGRQTAYQKGVGSMRLVAIKRCADCIWYKGVYHPPLDEMNEYYNGKCTAPKAIYTMRIDGDTKFYDGFPRGCPLEEG